MKRAEWKADPLFVLRAEFENIVSNLRLHGFGPATRIGLENLSQRLEEQALWRDGNKTGYVRFASSIHTPCAAKLYLRFDEPTELSDDESNQLQKILDATTKQLGSLISAGSKSGANL